MKQTITETEHIRNLLETIEEAPNPRDIKGPGDFDPPEDPPEPENQDSVQQADKQLKAVSDKFGAIKSEIASDPKAAFRSYKQYVDGDIEEDVGFLADLFPASSDLYSDVVVPKLNELEDIIEQKPKKVGEFKKVLSEMDSWLKSVDDMIEKYQDEIE